MVRETTGGFTKKTSSEPPQMAAECCRQTLDVSGTVLESHKLDLCPHDKFSFMTRMIFVIDFC